MRSNIVFAQFEAQTGQQLNLVNNGGVLDFTINMPLPGGGAHFWQSRWNADGTFTLLGHSAPAGYATI